MKMKPKKWIYLAEARYSKAGLVAVPVERETEKTYFVCRSEVVRIFGSVYVGDRVLKSAAGLRDNPKDAMDWIINKLKDRRIKASRNMQLLTDEITKIQEIKDDYLWERKYLVTEDEDVSEAS
jgi:hypothetical protein